VLVFRVSLHDVGFQRCQFSKFHYMIKVFRFVSFRVFHCMIIVFRGVRFRSSLCDVGVQSCQFSSVPLNDNCFQMCQISVIVV
jgi:hypothetical protein